MFSETPTDNLNSANKKNLNLLTDLESSDTTGYYTSKLNEIINEKYKIIGMCGKGIFSTVVKVVDFNNREFALKIIRNIDVMIISGEKERSILRKLNEMDKNGN